MKGCYWFLVALGTACVLGLGMECQAQHVTPTPEPTRTSTPTPVATLASLSIDCPNIDLLKGQVAAMLLRGDIDGFEAAAKNNVLDRMEEECEGYLASGSDGFGSFEDVFNDSEKREAVPSKLQALTETFKRRFETAVRDNTRIDASPMRDVVPEHPLWMGDDIGSILVRILDDQLDMFLDFGDLMSCLGTAFNGICIHWECFAFVCVPVPDALRSYRFPVAVVEGIQDRGMSGYTLGFLAELQVLSGMPLINNKSLIRANAQAVEVAVNQGMNMLKQYPRLMPNTGDIARAHMDSDAVGAAQDALEDSVESLRYDHTEARARNPRGEGFLRMEYHVNRTPLEQVFEHMWQAVPGVGQFLAVLGGPCHDRLNFNPFAGYWSEGGAFPLVSVPLSRFLFSNAAAFPAQMGFKSSMPTACSQYNMDQGEERLKSPDGLLHPLVRFSDDNGLTRECGTGNQQHVYGVTNTTPQLDLRSASEMAMLRGLLSVNTGRNIDPSGMVRRTLYGFDDDHENDEDRFWVMHDKDHREEWGGCEKFNSKTLKYARAWTLGKRDHSLNEFDPDEHDESDGAWNAGYHWRRFRCCNGDIMTQWSGKDGKKMQ